MRLLLWSSVLCVAVIWTGCGTRAAADRATGAGIDVTTEDAAGPPDSASEDLPDTGEPAADAEVGADPGFDSDSSEPDVADPAVDAEVGADTSLDSDSDGIPVDAEGCGASPTAPCAGDCGSGVWRCESAVWTCVAPVPNACGGCGLLPSFPGTACLATCGDGVWACAGDETVVCEGPEPNACGGCAPLDGAPGERCSSPCGLAAWECVGPDALACLGGHELNACGGCETFDVRLGDPCDLPRPDCPFQGTWGCSESGEPECQTHGLDWCDNERIDENCDGIWADPRALCTAGCLCYDIDGNITYDQSIVDFCHCSGV